MFWKGDPKCKGKPHLGFKFGLVHQTIILNWLYNLFLLINFIFIKQYWEPVIENCLIIIAWLHSNCKYSTTYQLTFSCLSIACAVSFYQNFIRFLSIESCFLRIWPVAISLAVFPPFVPSRQKRVFTFQMVGNFFVRMYSCVNLHSNSCVRIRGFY